jgi:pimeloyl-ACP methyl ester carboxylesterase
MVGGSRLTPYDGHAVSANYTIGTFAYREYELAYEDHGSGDRVVVLLHGILLDANLNRSLADELAARGYRVLLLDLLGHGRSDKPRHAGAHRMDLYAEQVVTMLDVLGVDEAVVGGVSLGADVALQVAVHAPERVAGLIVEMPVLEWAAPAAASAFIPLLLAVHYARPVFRRLTGLIARLPRTRISPLDSVLNALSLDPDEIAAVLHGVLLGPIAPTFQERSAITAPTLVIGHRSDLIHPFSDAQNLVAALPNARLLEAHSVMELRVRPARLVAEIASFLDALPTTGAGVRAS